MPVELNIIGTDDASPVIDKVAQELQRLASVAQNDLVAAFKKGDITAAEFNKRFQESGNALREYTAATETVARVTTDQLTPALKGASAATEEHAAKQTSLHEVLGSSRRETMLLEQSLLGLTGTTGPAGKAIEALATGMGTVGIAIVALSTIAVGLKEAMAGLVTSNEAVIKTLDEIGKKDQAADQLSKLAGVEVGAATSALLYAKTHEEAAAKLDTLLKGAQEATPVISGLEGAFKTAMTAGAQLIVMFDASARGTATMTGEMLQGKTKVGAYADGLKELHTVMQGMTDAQKEAIATQLRNMNLMSDAANVQVTFTEQTNASTEAIERQTAALLDANGQLLEFGKAGSIRAAGQQDEWKIKTDSIKEFVKEQAAAETTARNAGIKGQLAGQDIYEKAFTASEDRIASASKSASDKIISDAKRIASQTAATMAEFDSIVADASRVASAEVKAGFATIENSSLSASEKVSLLRQYIQTLPRELQTRIQLNIETHGDALLMKLLGGGGLPTPPGGNQQGNQALFTFVGESLETQKLFLEANNNDRAKAQREWEAQHLREVQASITSGFDMTGRMLTKLERDLGQSVIDAANDPTNSSHDPYAANSDDPKYKPPKFRGESDGGRSLTRSDASAPAAPTPIQIVAHVYNNADIEDLAFRVFQVAHAKGM
jgi:hypothetical protein